jgi:Tol biopolymer transport system component
MNSMTTLLFKLGLPVSLVCLLLAGLMLLLGLARPTAVLAYASEVGDTFLLDVDQARHFRLYTSLYRTGRLTWSPDGKRLLVENALGGDSTELVVIPLDGGAARSLIVSRVMNAHWSPDGDSVILDFMQNGDLFRLDVPCFLRRLSCGRVVEAITFPGSGGSDFFAGFSPDGWLLFTRVQDSTRSDVYALDLACTAARDCLDGAINLTADEMFESYAALAPDGGRVAYFATELEPFSAQMRLRGVCADDPACAAGVVTLPTVYANFSPPQWSPDARWLAYVSNDSGVESLYLLDSRCADCPPLPIENAPALDFTRHMLWSPDARWLLYRRANLGLFVVDVACAAAGCESPVQQMMPFYGFSMAWSPDSRQLAFVTDSLLGVPALFVVETACLDAAAGCAISDIRRLTTTRVSAAPAWRP